MKKQIKLSVLSVTAGALLASGCATDQQNTAKGAGIGAVAGAALGAIVGHQTGQRDKGAAIGALLGGGVGAAVGHRMDKQAKELEKIAETKRTEQGIVTKLKSDILFDTGKAELKSQAKVNLKEMATIMKKYPENILTVNGFTDNTGKDKTNEALSLKRADAVRAELTAHGISQNIVTARGLGPASPIADNGTADGRKQNRRVEIEITVDESKVPQENK